jgi:hypothetical protein
MDYWVQGMGLPFGPAPQQAWLPCVLLRLQKLPSGEDCDCPIHWTTAAVLYLLLTK